MVLDFLNEQLPWRSCKDTKVDEVKEIKTKCLSNPQRFLWQTTTSNITEVHIIFYLISKLGYGDRPDYASIRQQLNTLAQKEELKEHSIRSLDTKSSLPVT